jgi:hypothetical protein
VSPSEEMSNAEMVSASELLDTTDIGILAVIRETVEAIDPVPAGLIDRIHYALELDDIDAELCRMTTGLAVAARGGDAARTMTFDSSGLTVMITVSPEAERGARLDGWLVPAGRDPARPTVVELRTAEMTLTVTVDAEGRFVLADVPPGLVRLSVRTNGPGGESPMVTPAFVV